MNVIITGATSMIGCSLIKECILRGDKVYGVVRQNSKNLSRIENNRDVKIVNCDIEKYDNLPSMIGEKCDVLYHLAWKNAGEYSKRNANLADQVDNINYTLNALKAAHELECKTFVGAGSQAEYGIKDRIPISPGDTVDPVQPYGIAKYAAGRLARIQAERYRMNCFWVRIFSVYGEHDGSHTMINYTINSLLRNEVPKYTPAEQKWDYLYCDDAAEALYAIGKQETGNKVYCLGSGESRPLVEFIKMIRDRINPSLPIEIGAYDYPVNTVMNLCADISDITSDTGWIPKTSFLSGIDRILDLNGEDDS